MFLISEVLILLVLLLFPASICERHCLQCWNVFLYLYYQVYIDGARWVSISLGCYFLAVRKVSIFNATFYTGFFSRTTKRIFMIFLTCGES